MAASDIFTVRQSGELGTAFAAAATATAPKAPAVPPASGAAPSPSSTLLSYLNPWSYRSPSSQSQASFHRLAGGTASSTSSAAAAASSVTAVHSAPSSALTTPAASVSSSSSHSHSIPSHPVPMPGAVASTPVAVHPSFALLSQATPQRLASYLSPPPPYFRSHFQLNQEAVALALRLDPSLLSFSKRFTEQGMCMTEAEFWTRYFWLMSRLDSPATEEEKERYAPPVAPVAAENTVPAAAAPVDSPSVKQRVTPAAAAVVTTPVPASTPTAAPAKPSKSPKSVSPDEDDDDEGGYVPPSFSAHATEQQ